MLLLLNHPVVVIFRNENLLSKLNTIVGKYLATPTTHREGRKRSNRKGDLNPPPPAPLPAYVVVEVVVVELVNPALFQQ